MLEMDTTEQRLNYLSNRLINMYMTGTNVGELGDIAIEIMMTRVNLEEILDGDYPKDEKKNAKKMLLKLKEVERRAVSLFLMSRIAGAKTSETLSPFFSYIRQSYQTKESVE